MNTDTTTAPAPLLGGLTTWSALVERPLCGGADRVLELGQSRDDLRAKAYGANRDAQYLGSVLVVEDVTPLVVRLAGTDRHLLAGRGITGPVKLRVYLSADAAEERRADYAAHGTETVIEPLTPEVAARYPALEVEG
jgi:hypothetical protein